MMLYRIHTLHIYIVGCCLSFIGVCVPAAASTGVPVRWTQVMALNNLDVAGKTPFHLKIAFQLYDMDGRPSEEGTIEEWWASPKEYRLVITSPSVNVTVPGATDSKAKFTRARFLIDRLLEMELHPAPELSTFPTAQFEEKQISFGTHKMACIISGSQVPAGATTYCTEPSSDVLRLAIKGDGSANATRNSTGDFHGTTVAMALEVAYLDKLAITGKVVAFQSFDLSKSSMILTHPESSADETSGSQRLGVGVVAGKILDRTTPIYPSSAKAAHIGGAVILHAVISKQGKVEDLEPIAARSSMLVGAAMDAVKQWKYQPYLLNGAPTEVDTTITVNFNLNGG